MEIFIGLAQWKKTKKILHILAAADCTGHGVPGAFMSMIGDTILNEIVVTKNTDPSIILSQLHNGVRTALKQNQNTVATEWIYASVVLIRILSEITYAEI